MKKTWLLIELAGLLLLIGFYLIRPIPITNRTLDTAVRMVLSESDQAVTPEKLSAEENPGILLDVRAKSEYEISHLPGAIHVGEEGEYLPDSLQPSDRILVYCSIGKRSEDLMKELQSKGYQDVRNLYGGIFAWAEAGLPLESGSTTDQPYIHGYSSFWAKLTNYPRVYLESN